MKKLTIDFETRSSGADLRLCNPDVYASDPGCEILCLSLKQGNRAPVLWAPDKYRIQAQAYTFDEVMPRLKFICLNDVEDLINEADILEAHNVGFEKAVWKHQMVENWFMEPIPAEKWRCSQRSPERRQCHPWAGRSAPPEHRICR